MAGNNKALNVKAIFNELRCLECQNLLQGPTSICEEGHTFCKHCAAKLTTCSQCSASMLRYTRNNPIERIVGVVRNRCPNFRYGCRTYLSADMMMTHVKTCTFKPTLCPLTQIPHQRCKWQGPSSRALEHVKMHHAELLKSRNYFDCRNFEDTFCLVIHEDELFLYCKRVMDNIFYAIVVTNGLTPIKYKSIIVLHNPLCPEDMMSVTAPIKNLSEQVSEIVTSGCCLILDDAMLKHYVINNRMKMSVTIERVVNEI